MKRLPILIALLATLSACGSIVPEASKRQPMRQSTAVMPKSPDARQCLAELGTTKASFTPLADRYGERGCSALNTVRLEGVGTDNRSLAVTNLGSVGCPVASTFAAWARFGVDRAAREILGSPVVRIETMGSYACRNVAGTNRLSGHATASAIDISAFVLANGRRITVLDGWEGRGDERRFLRLVHASACKRFGTSLGPEYNAAHANHFHVEVRGSGFCR